MTTLKTTFMAASAIVLAHAIAIPARAWAGEAGGIVTSADATPRHGTDRYIPSPDEMRSGFVDR